MGPGNLPSAENPAPKVILEKAMLFDSVDKVVWEYVSNSLRHVDPGVSPVVRVAFGGRKRQISIIDNARGMDWATLEDFFGVSSEAKIGSRQSVSGTGSSAAFGIGDTLRITTTHEGKRTKVELTRRDIEAMNLRDQLPLRILEREAPASQPNGTIVEIDGVHVKSLNQKGVIRRIERYLSRSPLPLQKPVIFVNSHLCLPLLEEEKKLHIELESLSLSEVCGLIHRSRARRSEQRNLASAFGEKGVTHFRESVLKLALSDKQEMPTKEMPETEVISNNSAGLLIIEQLYEYWTAVQGNCYKELLRRSAPIPQPDPDFAEELEAHSAYLKRLAATVTYAPDELFDADHHRANFRIGLTTVFTRHLSDQGPALHLSISNGNVTLSAEMILAVLRAFFGETSDIRSWQGRTARHFERIEAGSIERPTA